jgi:hypothetical protein
MEARFQHEVWLMLTRIGRHKVAARCIEYLEKIDQILLSDGHSVQVVMSKYKSHMTRGRLD